MKKVQVFDPIFEVKEQHITFNPRLKSLQDLQIGLVDNTKFNSDNLLLKIAGILEKKYGAKSHIIRSKRKASVPDKAIIEEFVANCDVVISGIGDWGSCSSGSVLDGIFFEKQGIPAVSIVTDLFEETGRAIAQAWGLHNFKFLSMPHPIANLTEVELDQRARKISPKVVQLLLEGQEADASFSLASKEGY